MREMNRTHPATHAATTRRGFSVLRGALTASAVVALAGPAAAQIPAHLHGPGFTTWEKDGDIGTVVREHSHPVGGAFEEGDETHQHYIGGGFRGDGNQGGPFSFRGAWIDQTAYVQIGSDFSTKAFYTANQVGHGWINATKKPRYKFTGAEWTTDAAAIAAMPLINAAFGLWNGIHADMSPVTGVGLKTGFGFASTTGADYEIEVNWTKFDEDDGCGHVLRRNTTGTHDMSNHVKLEFDSDPRCVYDFNQSAAASDLSKWHIFSVALHEIGHLAWQLHPSVSRDTHLMEPSVGAPLGANVGDLSYRWDSYVENVNEDDYFAGRKYTRTATGTSFVAIRDNDAPDGIKSMYSIPVPEPGTYAFLLGTSTTGLLLFFRRRRS